MNRTTYINEVLRQHLQDDNKTNQIFSTIEVTSCMKVFYIRMAKIFSGKFSPHEAQVNYYILSTALPSSMVCIRYTRPPSQYHFDQLLVSATSFSVASTYIDYKLQPLTKTVPSYIKNQVA